MDYWKECVEEAFDVEGVKATEEQIKKVAEWMKSGHDNYGMMHGHACIPNPQKLENDRLKKELEQERRKVVCRACGGTGQWVSHGPIHSAYGTCSKCNGEGRHL